MTQRLSASFDTKTPALMSTEAYRGLLEKLLSQGQGYGKTKDVGGFLLRDIVLVTDDDKGNEETRRNVSVEKLYVVMDLKSYPSEKLRGLVIEDTAKNWGKRVIRERDLDSPDFKGPDIWAAKQSTFESDYLKADPANDRDSLYKPNPDAYRVCLEAEQDITFLMHWGEAFTVEKGGHVAIREKDVVALAEALQSIRDGKMTAEQALFTTDKKGQKIARFDVYGMKPGFLKGNYDDVELKEATKQAAEALKKPQSGTRQKMNRLYNLVFGN